MTTSIAGINFGVEIETVGATRHDVARNLVRELQRHHGIAATIGCTHWGRTYDAWKISTPKGVWKVMTDSSLSAERALQAEIVTPKLTAPNDFRLLLCALRAAKRAGARTDPSCAVHVHVDARAAKGVRGLVNLLRTAHRYEDVLSVLLANLHRITYCRGVDRDLIADLAKRRPLYLDDLAQAWYGRSDWRALAGRHYHPSRYRALNLHSVFYRETIEFRHFNGTLDPDELRGYVLLSLAMVAHSASVSRTVGRLRVIDEDEILSETDRMLETLGMIGPAFAVARRALKARAKKCAA